MKLKLTIELVPYDCFERNLRYILSKEDWDKVRKHTYKKYNHCCAICGTSNVVLSAHEEWAYEVTDWEKKKGKQKLINIWALCDNCHLIKHIGFADVLASQGKLSMDKLLEHFFTINNCSEDDFIQHYNDAIAWWNKIADIKFKIDIKYVKKLKLELDSYPLKKLKENGDKNV